MTKLKGHKLLEMGHLPGVGEREILIPRRKFSYSKLPSQLLRLSILKLDGSCFDVQISRTATVSELKLAVEKIFSQSPKEEISWSHVWGHFCLCYEGHKLLNDKESLRTLAIKDGDQLQFIRHLSINYNPEKRRTRIHTASREGRRMSSTGLDIHQEDGENAEDYIEDNYPEDKIHHLGSNEEAIIRNTEFKLAHFLKGWLSYSKLWAGRRTRMEGRTHPSKLGGTVFRVETNVTS